MGRLNGHSRIVRLLGFTFDDHTPILILELARFNLEEYLRGDQRVEWKAKLAFMYDIALGLEAIHKAEIVHGDLKAANVLIYDVGEDQKVAKISDFGFSSTNLSILQGRIPGFTIYFRSRECFDLEFKDWNGKPTTDIYSYGLVVHQIAHDGIVPFEEYDDKEIDDMKKEGTELKVLIEKLSADTPLEVRRIITSTVRNVPSERSSIDEVKEIIKESMEWDQNYSYEEAKLAFETLTQDKSYETIKFSEMNKLPIPPSLKKSIFSEYQRLADAGDIISLSRLGSCWAFGFGTEQDNSKAIECFTKAAEAGNPNAQLNLGTHYDRGIDVLQDFTKAAEWYRKSAEAGYIHAQYNLGDCYFKGEGVPQDFTKAVELFQMTAEKGFANAQEMLGYCYEKGCADFFGVECYGHLSATSQLKSINPLLPRNYLSDIQLVELYNAYCILGSDESEKIIMNPKVELYRAVKYMVRGRVEIELAAMARLIEYNGIDNLAVFNVKVKEGDVIEFEDKSANSFRGRGFGRVLAIIVHEKMT